MEQLSLPEAAEYLGVAVNTLRMWRYEGRGPQSHLSPSKRVVFSREELDRYIAELAASTTRAGR